MDKKKIAGVIILLICTIIWGAAFSFQAMAKDHIPPFSLIGIRFLIATVFVAPIVFAYMKKNHVKPNWKTGLIGGSIIGLFLAAASVVQQFGIERTSTGKAGFLTAMYIVFVPLISLFFKKRISWLQIFGVVITVVGTALLSLNEGFSMNFGDVLCLVCALLFAFQIMSVDHYGKKVDALFLALVSFFVCGLSSFLFSLFFERLTFEDVKASIWPLLYLGVGSSGIAYTLQYVGQRKISGVPASLIMSLEAVFSALFAWIILRETMSAKEIIGAILMMVGVFAVQIFEPKKKEL